MKDTMFLPPERCGRGSRRPKRCRPLAWPCGDVRRSPLLRGVVHDPTARRMDGVAGHAGLFSTAADLSRFCRMLLGGGRSTACAILSPATVARMTRRRRRPAMRDVRGLGWDIDSSYSSNRGELFPIGSFGHTGFTGTSLWLDPGDAELRRCSCRTACTRRQGRRDAAARQGRDRCGGGAAAPDDVARPPRARAFCRRRDFAAGATRRAGARRARTAQPVLTGIDVLAADGFAGCAASASGC